MKMMIYIMLLIAGMLAGAGIFYWGLMNKATDLMILDDESRLDFEETEAGILQAAIDKGWKVTIVHDLQQTMEKNGYQVKRVKVIEICKPAFAFEILSRDQERVVSSLLPCRVSVYERTDGSVRVSRLNSGLMAKPMKGVIPVVMKDATREVEELLASILK